MDNKDIKLNIKTKDNKEYKIPIEGSLAILALGDIGLLAWRKRKDEFIQEQVQNGNLKPIIKEDQDER